MPVGVKVTLRGERMWEMLDRLQSIAIPRIRDFRGLNPRSFDGRGNYSLGIREQIIFPEIDYDSIDQVRGLDVTITTTAKTDEEAFELLRLLGMPFRREERRAAAAPPRTRRRRGAPRRSAARRRGRSRQRGAAQGGERRRPTEAAEPRSAEPKSDDRRHESEEEQMAKTSQIVRQQRGSKYKTRNYNRCRRCGRPRAYYRKFGLCRICLREIAHEGMIPGMTKSSW